MWELAIPFPPLLLLPLFPTSLLTCFSFSCFLYPNPCCHSFPFLLVSITHTNMHTRYLFLVLFPEVFFYTQIYFLSSCSVLSFMLVTFSSHTVTPSTAGSLKVGEKQGQSVIYAEEVLGESGSGSGSGGVWRQASR